MDPGETIMGVVAMSLVFGTVMTIIRSVTKIATAKHRLGAGEGSGSLTGSELRRMITEAVNDATDSLHERLDRLERKVDAVRPQASAIEAAPRPSIEIPAPDAYEPVGSALPRQRTRS